MHDDIAQTLGYLGLQVDEIMDRPDLAVCEGVQAALEDIRKVIEQGYRRVRDSILCLSQDIPTDFDLRVALQRIIEEFTKANGCQVRMSVDVDWMAPLPPLIAIQAIYIVQEALNNARKHAQASTVYLSFQRLENGIVELVIRDDGRGFGVASSLELDERGLGLRFMGERAKRVGGTFEVQSEPGQGTQIVVHLPPS
jgi:two-component system nitrate/nitrite sensor histidine kinase NarX